MTKLNVSYINDLHVDLWIQYNPSNEKYEKRIKQFVKDLIHRSMEEYKFDWQNELLIIAGDISHYNRVTKWVLDEFSEWYYGVIFVGGNHDYYLISGNQRRKYEGWSTFRSIELSDMMQENEKVKVLGAYSDMIAIDYKGFRIGGITMTSVQESEEGKSFYNGFMNDKRYIKESPLTLNLKDMSYYQDLPKLNLDIFISHYPLITTYTHYKYPNDGSIESYKCKVDQLVAPINFFGHVHEGNQMYEVAESLHYTNALGYPHEELESVIRQITIEKAE